MDSASAHLSTLVLSAFRAVGLRYAIIPGGLTCFIQAIDVSFASHYRQCHHELYCTFMEGRDGRLTAAEARNAFIDLAYRGVQAAVAKLNVPQLFQDLGYIDPAQAKLRVPYQFNPPVASADPLPVPKPKPKPHPKGQGPRQATLTSFFQQQ